MLSWVESEKKFYNLGVRLAYRKKIMGNMVPFLKPVRKCYVLYGALSEFFIKKKQQQKRFNANAHELYTAEMNSFFVFFNAARNPSETYVY